MLTTQRGWMINTPAESAQVIGKDTDYRRLAPPAGLGV